TKTNFLFNLGKILGFLTPRKSKVKKKKYTGKDFITITSLYFILCYYYCRNSLHSKQIR
ncbi:hypothetical protein CpipJ_CPIJ011944, partial [Culex quinquefasciatus]